MKQNNLAVHHSQTAYWTTTTFTQDVKLTIWGEGDHFRVNKLSVRITISLPTHP